MSCVMPVSVSLLAFRVLCSPSLRRCLPLVIKSPHLPIKKQLTQQQKELCRLSLQNLKTTQPSDYLLCLFSELTPFPPTRLLPAPEPSRTPLQHRSHLLSALLLLAHALPCRRKSSRALFTHRTPKDLSPWVPVRSLGFSTTSAGPVVLHQTNLKHTSD